MAESWRVYCTQVRTFPCTTPLGIRISPHPLPYTMRRAHHILRALRSGHRQLSLQPVISVIQNTTACSRGPQDRSWSTSTLHPAQPKHLTLDSKIRGGKPHPQNSRDVSVQGRPRKVSLVDAAADTSSAVPSASAATVANPLSTTTPPADVPKRKRQPTTRVAVANPPLPVAMPLDLAVGAPSPEIAAAWTGVKEWVVFSDLHVSAKTVKVAVEVLRAVHAEAVRRDAGILFLGAI